MKKLTPYEINYFRANILELVKNVTNSCKYIAVYNEIVETGYINNGRRYGILSSEESSENINKDKTNKKTRITYTIAYGYTEEELREYCISSGYDEKSDENPEGFSIIENPKFSEKYDATDANFIVRTVITCAEAVLSKDYQFDI